ncbi:MAG TPA: glycosyltransferase family 39 protein, partial [Tepidisphaeraceae bacterium]
MTPRLTADIAPEQAAWSARWLVCLWVLAGILMLAAAGTTAVSRTQEARVLVTASEMVDRPLHDWLIPKANGQVRLKKPPLAYWLSAASIDAFGNGERAGRLPAVLAGWATLGLMYAIGRKLFNPLAGTLAALALMSSW